MIYKFKSRATGDLLMLGPHGDQLLAIIGRTPAGQGIIEVAAMPAAIRALEAAVAAELPAAVDDDDDDRKGPAVSLRQRVWPRVEMMKLASAERQPIVWGV